MGANGTIRPGNKRLPYPPKKKKKCRFNDSPEARTSEILCKLTEEQNHRLTTGLSAVDNRLISGTRSALCSWLPTSGTTPFCLCKPFSCKACPGIGFTRFHSTNSTTAFLAPLSPQTKSNSLNIPLQARTKEFLCKPAGEQNPQLTTGLSAVYHQDEKRSSFLDAH